MNSQSKNIDIEQLRYIAGEFKDCSELASNIAAAVLADELPQAAIKLNIDRLTRYLKAAERVVNKLIDDDSDASLVTNTVPAPVTPASAANQAYRARGGIDDKR